MDRVGTADSKYLWHILNVIDLMQVGGMEEAYIAAKPLFLSMGKNTIYCGGTGNGAVSLLLYLIVHKL